MIVTPELPGITPSGGIGTFVLHFARLLQEAGEAVLVLVPGEARKRSAGASCPYQKEDFQVKRVPAWKFGCQSVGAWSFVMQSHGFSEAIPAGTDIVYVQDWLGHGFIPVRRARQSPGVRPVYVNVIHSPTSWIREAMCEYPRHFLEDMSRDFAERYVAEHSDFVVAPSKYILDWARGHGWKLPADEKTAVMGYPCFQPDKGTTSLSVSPPNRFHRIAFLGRYEVRKGIDLFVRATSRLYRDWPEGMAEIREIAFVGPQGNVGRMPPRKAKKILGHTHATLRFLQNLDTPAMVALLGKWAEDTLVVIPSLDDNFPYVVIEASMVPGLNILCARTGGIPEILPDASPETFFLPREAQLAGAIKARLEKGPVPPGQLPKYDKDTHNRQWLEFHKQAGSTPRSAPPRITEVSRERSSVDVCIPCFNHAGYLTQLLDALEKQTVSPRTVTIIDDHSTDPTSPARFEALRQRHADKNWHFEILGENRGVSGARNYAAAKGNGDYLLFLDADNVPKPRMIESFLSSVLASGDDCLTSYFTAFKTPDGCSPPDSANVSPPPPKPFYHFLPLGACAALGMLENFFGDASFFVRRSVFEGLGGFCEDEAFRYATHEDYDFLLRLVLAGHRLDVVPEFLFFYRVTNDGLTQTTDEYRNRLRIQRNYTRLLKQVDLPELVPYVIGMHERGKPVEFLAKELQQAASQPFLVGRKIFSRLTKRKKSNPSV